MLMNIKNKGFLKESIIILALMTGEERMYYLERMWDLYNRVYEEPGYKKLPRSFTMDKKKAYDMCSKLTKIFGH